MLFRIEHVVVLMMENRSLDNVLGWLSADEPASRIVGADSTSPYQGLHTRGLRQRRCRAPDPGDERHRGAQRPREPAAVAGPLGVRGLDPHEGYPHVKQQLFGGDPLRAPPLPPTGEVPTMAGFANDFDAGYESDGMLDQIMAPIGRSSCLSSTGWPGRVP